MGAHCASSAIAVPAVRLVASDDGTPIETILAETGVPALPHYIHRPPGPEDLTEYQTVYADKLGAVAAPTAGLHFTEESAHRIGRGGDSQRASDPAYRTRHFHAGSCRRG